MNKKLQVATLSTILSISLWAIPVAVLAQDEPTGDEPAVNNPGATTTTDERRNNNWWWILPLALIPVALLMLRGNKDRDRSKNSSRGEYESAAYHDVDRNRRNREDSDKD